MRITNRNEPILKVVPKDSWSSAKQKKVRERCTVGLLTIKTIFAGTIATSVIAGGLMFAGGDTVDSAKGQLNVLKDKVVQYEVAEGSLLDKISQVKFNANLEIGKAKQRLKDCKIDWILLMVL